MSAQATERLQQVVGEGYRLLEPAQKYTRAFCTDDRADACCSKSQPLLARHLGFVQFLDQQWARRFRTGQANDCVTATDQLTHGRAERGSQLDTGSVNDVDRIILEGSLHGLSMSCVFRAIGQINLWTLCCRSGFVRIAIFTGFRNWIFKYELISNALNLAVCETQDGAELEGPPASGFQQKA